MKKISYIIVHIIQVLLIFLLFLLNYFSQKSAGVNHHIIARTHQLEMGIFSQKNLLIASILILVLILIFGFLLLKQKGKSKGLRIEYALLVLVGIFIALSCKTALLEAVLIKSYIIISALLIFLIQTIVVSIVLLDNKKYTVR
ncbi:MAG: hypothetical protein ACRC76_00125 [Proteocatella sp.]